ncbi:MAG: M1 family metallopeptidase, partial [Bacteroidetes bacterium]|nr:M1 family metallopeptidase [Bacteroidota bacterium]
MHRIIYIIVSIFIVSTSFAQTEIFDIDTTVPGELRKVSQADWQQRVNYNINVSLDDQNHFLNANIQIEYINNSPDEITEIWMHLWPNAYKNDSTPFAKQQIEDGKKDFYYSSEKERGYIDNMDFTVDGEAVVVKMGSSIDICYLKLNKPLKPGEYCIIRTPFRVKIPQSYSRHGHVKQSYQITQWYPKPAVYDVNGWNPIPYLDQGEFYSEFGKFDVTINVPDSYVVATSGIPVVEKKFDDRKEITYTENNIHDFAWFADKSYLVDSQTVTLESGKKVQCYSYFKNLKDNGISHLTAAVLFRSKTLAEYPFSHIASVASSIKAGAGMEYPCITVVMNGDETTIEHEVGHNWFYGILGSYEREYAWMDEGLNSYYDIRYSEQKDEKRIAKNKTEKQVGYHYNNEEFQSRLLWEFQTADHQEQPIHIPSGDFSPINYGAIVYGKSAIAFKFLEHYLGRKIFDSAMRIYYDTWKFKHPLPNDFRNVIETVSQKNLSWFFDQVLKTNRRIDYKILGIHKIIQRPLFWMIDIENTGEINAPFFIGGFKDGKLNRVQKVEGFWGTKTIVMPDSGFSYITIDPEGLSIEVNRKNNTIKPKGLFKRIEPIKLKLGFNLNNPFYTQLNWLPVIAKNNNDGWMVGMALYNQSIFTKNNAFSLIPMYGVKSKELSGIANFTKKIFFENELTDYIQLRFEARKFQLPDSTFTTIKQNYYIRLAPEVTIFIKKSSSRSSISNNFNLKYINIVEYSDRKYGTQNDFFNITFNHENDRIINPYKGKAFVQLHKDFQKITTEWKGGINLSKPNKRIYYRLFGGFMYYNKLQKP